jgi:DNA anti-recombination protein RmuC
MQKAIILGCLRGPVDLLRAMSLLDSIIKSNEPHAQRLQPMATLLYANYSEWRRLDDALDKQGQQLKEAQRRSDQLNQKLEDLKAIEQQLPSRPHAGNEGHS